MADEPSDEIEGEHYLRVPMAHYNSMVEAADIGFGVLVERRNALRDLARRVSQYPERDSSKMKPMEHGLLDGMPLHHQDIVQLENSYTARIERLAEALNHRLHNRRYQ